jgi:uroporphyrinogen decarboxylase
MPDFQNLKTALLCQGEPAYVPLFEGSVHDDIKSRFLGKPTGTLESEVEFAVAAGYDYVHITMGMRQTMRGEKLGLMGARSLDSTVLKAATARYNPSQQQESTRLWAEEGQGLIRDDASFDNFPWPDPDSDDYSALDRLGKILPPDMKVIVNVGYIFTAPWMLMGLESFCIGLAARDPLPTRIIQRVSQIQYRVVENVLQFDCVGAIRMPDDFGYTTGLIVSPRLLREHVFPTNKKIGDLVVASGLPYLCHSDGKLYDVIDDLIACGFNALHPCEPASMDIAALKQKYQGRLCLCGNINLDSTLTLGTPQEVEEEVKLRLRTVAPGGGYCCGASNSVPEYVPFENYLAMIETVKKYGQYPIRV